VHVYTRQMFVCKAELDMGPFFPNPIQSNPSPHGSSPIQSIKLPENPNPIQKVLVL